MEPKLWESITVFYCCMRVTKPCNSLKWVYTGYVIVPNEVQVVIPFFFFILKSDLISTPCKLYVVLIIRYLKKRGHEIWISCGTTKVIRFVLFPPSLTQLFREIAYYKKVLLSQTPRTVLLHVYWGFTNWSIVIFRMLCLLCVLILLSLSNAPRSL